jgi:hypothetical protein
MAMRVESSVTSLSWIPSEVVTGLTRLSFASGLSHRGPPRAQLDDLNRMHEDDAFRFANVLHAWAEFDGNRVAASGDGWVRFTQTTGGRTALWLPRRTGRTGRHSNGTQSSTHRPDAGPSQRVRQRRRAGQWQCLSV